MSEIKKVSPIMKFKFSNQKNSNESAGLLLGGESSSKPEKVYIEMGNKIKQLRTKHNLTQTDLADQLGVSPAYIGLIEQGKRGGADEFLFKMEEFFKLENKTLLKLRDIQITDGFQDLERKAIANQYPDFIEVLVDALLSCGEDYAKQKVPNWLKELQDDYYNRLTPYELKEVKKQVIAVKRSWVEGQKGSESSEEDSHLVQGYIMQDEQKHFFSLQLNGYALTLNLLHKDRQQAQYFEGWLGTCSISYSTPQQLPYWEKEEKVSCYLWFNPHVSITDMYRYLKDLDINVHNMDINEHRLNWYIHELTIENDSNVVQ